MLGDRLLIDQVRPDLRDIQFMKFIDQIHPNQFE